MATSLDGYIADANGSVEYLDSVQDPNEDYGYQQFMAKIDTLVIGRKTYETTLSFPGPWPHTGKHVIVLTHQPNMKCPKSDDVEFFSGDVKQLSDKLLKQSVKNVYIDGGNIIRQFLKARLVDEITVSLIPVLLGDGIALFKGITEESFGKLNLLSSKTFSSTGLVQVTYRVM
ncbi:dihydrofolate reductase [Paraphysoderma sedebokerense]|nr:dihydrofolate reductase [Paraphysoderma sedebokerense]